MTKIQFHKNLECIYSAEERKTLYYIILQYLFDAPLSVALIKEMEGFTIEQEQKLSHITERLVRNEPIQYILGECLFRDITWKVTPDVLIPRPETSELIDWICEEHKEQEGKILDIGTGSGCIAISLKKELPRFSVHASDISEKALQIAKNNAKNLAIDITFHCDDILNSQLTNLENWDIIVSNPPYIMNMEKVDMSVTVLNYEPHTALFVPDEDPLLFYRSIAQFGKEHLKKNGSLYFEINGLLGNETITLLKEMGYKDLMLKTDDYGKERMVRCKK